MSKRAPTVYAFMDESGDPGSPMRKGASRYFIVVWVETTEPEILHAELQKLRKQLNVSAIFEFRYHDTQMPWARAAFFRLLKTLDVRVRCAVLDKTRLSRNFVYGQHAVYQFVLSEMVLRTPASELEDAVLVLDGQKGVPTEDLLLALRKRLREIYAQHQRTRAFAKIVVRGAKSEDGLQFADMIAGVLAERFEHGESAYDPEVDSKIVDLWVYPPQ